MEEHILHNADLHVQSDSEKRLFTDLAVHFKWHALAARQPHFSGQGQTLVVTPYCKLAFGELYTLMRLYALHVHGRTKGLPARQT